jgi:hypothetical protein
MCRGGIGRLKNEPRRVGGTDKPGLLRTVPRYWTKLRNYF